MVEQDEMIVVVPSKSPLEFNNSKELAALSKVTDLKLIAAILSGKLEPAVVEPPSCKYSYFLSLICLL